MFDDEMRVGVVEDQQPKRQTPWEMMVEIRDNIRELQALVRAAIEAEKGGGQ